MSLNLSYVTIRSFVLSSTFFVECRYKKNFGTLQIKHKKVANSLKKGRVNIEK